MSQTAKIQKLPKYAFKKCWTIFWEHLTLLEAFFLLKIWKSSNYVNYSKILPFQVQVKVKYPTQVNFQIFWTMFGSCQFKSCPETRKKSFNCPLMWGNWTSSPEHEYPRP
jgi:hypothetical protein